MACADVSIDITNLKYLMHKANLHTDNPALFKAINDRAKKSTATQKEYEGTWTREQFRNFFLNTEQKLNVKPSLDDMVCMFELLDTKKDGQISTEDLCRCIGIIDNLRETKFDLELYLEKYGGTGQDGFQD